jgi:predicted site-specific integrase-resolvase
LYRESDFTKKIYKPKELVEILGVSHSTVRKYDVEGKLPVKRTETNRRIVHRDDLLAYLDSQGLLYRDDDRFQKVDVIYARVSSHEQKAQGDLDRQALYLVEQVPNLVNPVIIKEVGSGLNDKRNQLHKLIKMVMSGKVGNVYVTYRDRLTRFGFHYLEAVFRSAGTEIVVVKDMDGEKSVQEELVEDMMALIASFSGKLYGLRSGKKKGHKRYPKKEVN